jgi:hypothetical protein
LVLSVFGSFFATILTARELRIAATAVLAWCLEPGHHTIFEEDSPTFKKRFTWMSNYTDEAKFNEFVKGLTWKGHAEKIIQTLFGYWRRGRQAVPLRYTEEMIGMMNGPGQLVSTPKAAMRLVTFRQPISARSRLRLWPTG